MVGTTHGGFVAFRARRLTTGSPIERVGPMSDEAIAQTWAPDISRCKSFMNSREGERCWRSLAFRLKDRDFCYHMLKPIERASCVNELEGFPK